MSKTDLDAERRPWDRSVVCPSVAWPFRWSTLGNARAFATISRPGTGSACSRCWAGSPPVSACRPGPRATATAPHRLTLGVAAAREVRTAVGQQRQVVVAVLASLAPPGGGEQDQQRSKRRRPLNIGVSLTPRVTNASRSLRPSQPEPASTGRWRASRCAARRRRCRARTAGRRRASRTRRRRWPRQAASSCVRRRHLAHLARILDAGVRHCRQRARRAGLHLVEAGHLHIDGAAP